MNTTTLGILGSLLLNVSTVVNASSSVDDLMSLCKGNIKTKDVVEIVGEIEGKILKIAKAEIDGEGKVKKEGTISQYDLIREVKGGMSEDLYKHEIGAYYTCIEKMAPIIIGVTTSIADLGFNS